MIRRASLVASLTLILAADASGQTSLTINRILWVEATGTPTQNCTALRNTLDGLVGTTGEEAPYLVKLEPGKYSCGTNTVTIPSWVAVEGTGPRTTQIFGTPNSSDTGIVHFDHATNAELRWVRVHHSGGTQDAVVISVDSSTVNIEHIFAFTLNDGQTASGIWVEGGPDFPDQSVVLLRDSVVVASLEAIRTQVTSLGAVSVDVFGSEIDGIVSTVLGGSVRCAGSYDFGSYLPLDINCAPPP